MKAIIYLLIAVFVFEIFAMGMNRKPDKAHTIILQSTDRKVSAGALTLSAEVMSKRLKLFSPEKFEVNTISEKQVIAIQLSDKWDLHIAEALVAPMGKFGFYETYSRKSFLEQNKDNQALVSILQDTDPLDSSARLKCFTTNTISVAHEYLKSTAPNFVYQLALNDLFNAPEICLYALKTDKGH